MKKVLVLGGSGFVGRHLCEQLVRAGWHITVATRTESHAAHVQHLPGLTVLKADIHDPTSLQGLLSGHTAVINLVAILHGNQQRFEQTHVELLGHLASACQASGVRRVLHVSALGVNPHKPEAAPSLYLASKSRGEALLQKAGLQLTVLRPSVIYGADDRFLNLFAKLQRIFPVLPLAGAKARFQPVWVEDVARALVVCLENPQTIGKTYELYGPEILTLAELAQLAAQGAGVNHGKGRPIIALPAPLARLQARLMELAPGEPLMSRDNLDSMRAANIASGNLPGLDALGIEAASIRAIAPSYLARPH